MKEIATSLRAEGLCQELFHCSSDSRSLDAVVFPEIKVALIDATKPHALEPQWPGCRDELLYLGRFWSQDDLVKKRKEIVEVGAFKQSCFNSAFRYLEAARLLEENIAARNSGLHTKRSKVHPSGNLEEMIWSKRNKSGENVRSRHLFAAAITPEGYVSYTAALAQGYSQKYVLIGPPGSGKSQYLRALTSLACANGIDSEVFHYPLDPRKILHVLFPQLDLAVFTALEKDPLREIEGEILDFGIDLPSQQDQDDRLLSQRLFNQGILALQDAQKAHLKLEGYYAAQMDFPALDRYRQQVLDQILDYKNLS